MVFVHPGCILGFRAKDWKRPLIVKDDRKPVAWACEFAILKASFARLLRI